MHVGRTLALLSTLGVILALGLAQARQREKELWRQVHRPAVPESSREEAARKAARIERWRRGGGTHEEFRGAQPNQRDMILIGWLRSPVGIQPHQDLVEREGLQARVTEAYFGLVRREYSDHDFDWATLDHLAHLPVVREEDIGRFVDCLVHMRSSQRGRFIRAAGDLATSDHLDAGQRRWAANFLLAGQVQVERVRAEHRQEMKQEFVQALQDASQRRASAATS